MYDKVRLGGQGRQEAAYPAFLGAPAPYFETTWHRTCNAMLMTHCVKNDKARAGVNFCSHHKATPKMPKTDWPKSGL
jgi:hypothetical protein